MNRAFLLPKLQLRSVRGKGKNDLRRAASMHQQIMRSAICFVLGCQQRAHIWVGGRMLPLRVRRVRVSCGRHLAQFGQLNRIPVNFSLK